MMGCCSTIPTSVTAAAVARKIANPGAVQLAFNPARYSHAIGELMSSNWQSQYHAQLAAEKAFAGELQIITNVPDPEETARLVHALKFQVSLLRFALDIRFTPLAQKLALTKFWLSDAHAPLLAGVLSHNAIEQIAGLNGIKLIPGWQIDDLLGFRLSDFASSNPHVVSAFCNALAARPPSPELVHVTARLYLQLKHFWPRVWVNAMGKEYYAAVFAPRHRVRETNLLSLLFVKWTTPAAQSLVAGAIARPNFAVLRPLRDVRTVGDCTRLLVSLRARHLIPALVIMLREPFTGASINQPGAYFDSRTGALYVLVRLLGKNVGTYHFQSVSNNWGSPYAPVWCVDSRNDQRKDIARIIRWCQSHGVITGAAPSAMLVPVPPDVRELRETITAADLRIRQSLDGVASSRFQVRRHAGKALADAIRMQTRAVILAGTRGFWQATWPLLQFEYGLTRFAIMALQAPPAVRKVELHWCFVPANRQLAAYSFVHDYFLLSQTADRLSHRHNDPVAMRLLAHLLNSRSQYVFLHAALAYYHFVPTPRMVHKLYSGCVPGEFSFDFHPPTPVVLLGQKIVLNSKPLPIMHFHAVDAAILTHWKPPAVKRLLVETLAKWVIDGRKMKYCPVNGQARSWPAFLRLFNTYRPVAAIPLLLQLIKKPGLNVMSGGQGNKAIYIDNRMYLIRILIAIVGRQPTDFGMVHVPHSWASGSWAFRGLSQENRAVDALKQWCMTHGLPHKAK
jgi:hypothetical protein